MRTGRSARPIPSPASTSRALPSGEPATPSLGPLVVATLLTPDVQARVDAAGQGAYRARHRSSLEEILDDLKRHGADVVLLGLDQCAGQAPSRVASLVREFPRVPALALMTGSDAQYAPVALALGQAGVRRLVDVRSPSGWHELRLLLAQQRQDLAERRLAALVREQLPTMHHDLRRFFEHLIGHGGRVRTVRELARLIGVRPASLTSRFFRAGVPGPKHLLAMVRLVRAAAMLDNPGLSIAQVAYRLGYSSPQCFNRHIRRWTGQTAFEFRGSTGLDRMLDIFRDKLLVPHGAALATLRPFGGFPHAPPRKYRRDVVPPLRVVA
jgi:AraC-like DNA-binding protein